MRVATQTCSMLSYRTLAHNVQKRVGLSFEPTLVFISFCVRAIAHHLSAKEARLFKNSIPLELRQLVVEGRAGGLNEMRQLIDVIADRFSISAIEAKRRALTLLEEFRAGVSPWDDVEYVEALDRLRRELDAVFIDSAAA